jgi:hypothetical protein
MARAGERPSWSKRFVIRVRLPNANVDFFRTILSNEGVVFAKNEDNPERAFQDMKEAIDAVAMAVEVARREYFAKNVHPKLTGQIGGSVLREVVSAYPWSNEKRQKALKELNTLEGRPKKCQGATCYGCPVLCPEREYIKVVPLAPIGG